MSGILRRGRAHIRLDIKTFCFARSAGEYAGSGWHPCDVGGTGVEVFAAVDARPELIRVLGDRLVEAAELAQTIPPAGRGKPRTIETSPGAPQAPCGRSAGQAILQLGGKLGGCVLGHDEQSSCLELQKEIAWKCEAKPRRGGRGDDEMPFLAPDEAQEYRALSVLRRFNGEKRDREHGRVLVRTRTRSNQLSATARVGAG